MRKYRKRGKVTGYNSLSIDDPDNSTVTQSPFRKIAGRRIATISLLLSLIISPLAWYIERERAEESVVAMAIEESRRLLYYYKALDLSGPEAVEKANVAAKTIVGGLFDIAEIYDKDGNKLAWAATEKGKRIEEKIPSHGRPNYTTSSYESLKLADGQWVLRVFVPMYKDVDVEEGPIMGYFEGVRIVPKWQVHEIYFTAILAAFMVGIASLLCGVVIYPVVVHLSAENEQKTIEVLNSHISMMESLGRAIAKRDSETGAHNYRVAWISARIAEHMGIKGSEMQSLIAGSFLHDVGKIGIPDYILLKSGPLDDKEMEIMRSHVRLGEEIVRGMGWLEGARTVVAGHHEKWDGSGYPRRLAGKDIPLHARIFAVADVFDALCSKRPYKEPLPFDTVMEILDQDTGRHFDPEVMAVFRPMANNIYRTLYTTDDEEVPRSLLEEYIRRYFWV